MKPVSIITDAINPADAAGNSTTVASTAERVNMREHLGRHYRAIALPALAAATLHRRGHARKTTGAGAQEQ